MSIIEQLLPQGTVADREQMLAEALTARVISWLEQPYFDVRHLEGLRQIANEIVGRRFAGMLPLDFMVLHSVSFSSLSPVNRRAAIESAIEFVGCGPEVNGAGGWDRIQRRIEQVCAYDPEGISVKFQADGDATPGVDPWALHAIANGVGALFSPPRFDVLERIEVLHRAMNRLRAVRGMPELPPLQMDPRWAALETIDFVTFMRVSPQTRPGVLNAVEAILGLDRDGSTLFGETLLAEQRWRLHRGFDEMLTSSARRVSTSWARLRAALRLAK